MAFSWAASLIGLGFGVFPELRATHLIKAERLTQQYFLLMVHDNTLSNTVSDYLFLGIAPGSVARRWTQWLRLPLRALRRWLIAVRMDMSIARGAAQARALIERQRLQPLARERLS